MPIAVQPKLLRVLEDRIVRRVGGSQEFQVDVRVLAASNQEPRKAVETKKLREDLFYRLNVFTVTLPPLREHREDIPLLVRAFIQEYNKKHNSHVESCKARDARTAERVFLAGQRSRIEKHRGKSRNTCQGRMD